METCKKCKKEMVNRTLVEQYRCGNCGYTWNAIIAADVLGWAAIWKKAATSYRRLANSHADRLATAAEKLVALDKECDTLNIKLETTEKERDELRAELEEMKMVFVLDKKMLTEDECSPSDTFNPGNSF